MLILRGYLRHYWKLVATALGLAAVNQVFSLLDSLRSAAQAILVVEQSTKILSFADYGYLLEQGDIVASTDEDVHSLQHLVERSYLGTASA